MLEYVPNTTVNRQIGEKGYQSLMNRYLDANLQLIKDSDCGIMCGVFDTMYES